MLAEEYQVKVLVTLVYPNGDFCAEIRGMDHKLSEGKIAAGVFVKHRS